MSTACVRVLDRVASVIAALGTKKYYEATFTTASNT